MEGGSPSYLSFRQLDFDIASDCCLVQWQVIPLDSRLRRRHHSIHWGIPKGPGAIGLDYVFARAPGPRHPR